MTLAETRRRKNLTINKRKKEAGYLRKIVVVLGDEAKGEGR